MKIHRHIRRCLLITYMLFCWFTSSTLLHNAMRKFGTFFRATRYINNQILQLEQLHNTISTCRPKISWKNTSSVNSRRSVFMPHTVAKYQSQGTCCSKITINGNGRTRWSLYGVLAGVSAKSLVHSIRTRSHSKPHSVIIRFCSRRRNKYAYRLHL